MDLLSTEAMEDGRRKVPSGRASLTTGVEKSSLTFADILSRLAHIYARTDTVSCNF